MIFIVIVAILNVIGLTFLNVSEDTTHQLYAQYGLMSLNLVLLAYLSYYNVIVLSDKQVKAAYIAK
jgi:hypothetical protein